ncbi:MAG: carbon storage regulator CsrA [Actinomycetota bacterium]
MLVLSRRKGESVIIGDNVTITVVDVRGDQIRLGIDAPRSVKVYREEVYRQVVAENEAAARSVDAAADVIRRARRRPPAGG